MVLAPGWPALAFLAFVVLQRLSELAIARHNTAALLHQGAREVGAGHYPVMVVLHASWILALIVWGWDGPLHTGWLAVYALLQGFRLWILGTLGRRWTTRIIVYDGPLVISGPFRYLRHPNYVLVVAEIAVTPLVLGLWPVALIWSVLNAAMLWHRIAVEDAALKPRRNAA